jgi:predicted Zn-dependent protease
MKKIVVLFLCTIGLSFLSFETNNQDVKTAVATYDGYDYEVFNFSISGEDDEADIFLTFRNIPKDILKTFDLVSDNLIGESFNITYEVVSGDDTEDDAEETYILKSLKNVE